MTIDPETNPVVGLTLWRAFLIYRLNHLNLQRINGTEVHTSSHTYIGIGVVIIIIIVIRNTKTIQQTALSIKHIHTQANLAFTANKVVTAD